MTADSERGGRSAINGFRYEKNIIAFLSIRMYYNREKIQRIICEYRNDIEVEHEELGLCSWQIKTSGTKKLSKKEILSSLDLFNELNKQDRYAHFILLNDNNISYNEFGINKLYSFHNLDPRLQEIIRKQNYDNDFLSKLYFVRGPSQDSVRANLEHEVIGTIDKERIVDSLLKLIDEIWGGITDLKDMRFVKFDESGSQEKIFKTIDKIRISNMIEPELYNDLDSSYVNIVNTSVDTKTELKVHDSKWVSRLMKDFKNPDDRMSVLESFSKISEDSDLYKNKRFIKFLNSTTKTNDKYETIQIVYVINNIIMRSLEQKDENYELLVTYFTKYLKRIFSSANEQCIHSYTSIRPVIERLYKKEEVCKLSWLRIINFINHVNCEDKFVLENCILDIEYLRDKCDMKESWIRFLRAQHARKQLLKTIYKLIYY